MDVRTRELLERLASGVAELTSSPSWERHLRFQSRFHQYSASNVMLIAAQCPTATQVAGYRTWLRLGRNVRKGEAAIWILAPMRRGRARYTEHDPDDRDVWGFRAVPVFDLGQTAGEPVPEVCHRLEGDDPGGSFDRLASVAADAGFTVELADLDGRANGECRFDRRTLRIERQNSGAQRVKTLAHELAHALLHAAEPDQARAELEAESVAYVVSSFLGVDSGVYSFGYLASWSGGSAAATDAIKASCRRIQRCAKAILEPWQDDQIQGGADAGSR